MEKNTLLVSIIIVLIIIFIFYNRKANFDVTPEDKVLIFAYNSLSEGAFGMGLIYTLQAVEILENGGVKPENVVFDVNSFLYGKIVPGMMNPKIVNNFNTFDKKLGLSQGTSQLFKKIDNERNREDYFKSYNMLFNKWFKIPDEVFPKIPNFDGNTTLGIHYRGTDKKRDLMENTPISSEDFILIVEDFLNKHKDINTIFIATDEEDFISKMSHLNIVQFNQTRSTDGGSLHKNTKFEGNDKIINPWVDVVALSRCKYVLKVSSALSAWAKILNPDLEIYQVNATRQKWYPTAAIPLYNSDTPEIRKILDRTLKYSAFSSFKNYIGL